MTSHRDRLEQAEQAKESSESKITRLEKDLADTRFKLQQYERAVHLQVQIIAPMADPANPNRVGILVDLEGPLQVTPGMKIFFMPREEDRD